MVRCAQFVGLVHLAVSLGWLVAASSSALAADGTPDLQRPARAQALQPATGDCSPTDQLRDTCSPRPATTAQLRTAPGTAQPPTAGTCRLAQGGQCCTQVGGARLCTPVPASGTCPGGSICCSEAQRADGTCAPRPAAKLQLQPPPGAPRVPVVGLCHLVADGMCCSKFAGTTLCTPAPASGTCPGSSVCCSDVQRKSGACPAPPPPSPAAEICPPLFRTVDGTCCSQSDVAYICFPRSSGGCLPTDGSYNDGVVSACCRENTGGVCVPPPAPRVPTPTRTRPAGEEFCIGLAVPGVGLVLVCAGGFAGECFSDNECPTGMRCRVEDRQCVEP
jgi:hypothetical protein